MVTTICQRCAQKGIPKWLPVTVDAYRDYLLQARPGLKGDKRYYALSSNIAYELQYLEFIEFEMRNISITDSLNKQLVKTYVITASNIIEGILFYELELSINKERVTFNDLIREAKRINLLKAEVSFYDKVYKLKDLRNKSHIQLSQDSKDTDYNSFSANAFKSTKNLLYKFFIKMYKLSDEDDLKKNLNFLDTY